MGAPIIYKYDDTDAPVCDGSRGSLIAMLKACLVDGYGSKIAAGWTMPFVNAEASVAAFRNDSVDGTGMFLRVDNAYGASNEVKMQGFETMSDEEAGSGPFVSDARYHRPSNTTTATQRPWLVVADNRIVYIFNWFLSPVPLTLPVAVQQQVTCFGDIISLYDPDPYGCILWGSVSANNAGNLSKVNVSTFSPTATTGGQVARNINGDIKETHCGLIAGGGPVGTVSGMRGAPFGAGVPVMISRPLMIDDVAFHPRGYLPGLWNVCHQYPYDLFDTVTIDAKDYLVVESATGFARGQFLFDVSATFRP